MEIWITRFVFTEVKHVTLHLLWFVPVKYVFKGFSPGCHSNTFYQITDSYCLVMAHGIHAMSDILLITVYLHYKLIS